jgi:hypothetical protein
MVPEGFTCEPFETISIHGTSGLLFRDRKAESRRS